MTYSIIIYDNPADCHSQRITLNDLSKEASEALLEICLNRGKKITIRPEHCGEEENDA